MTFKILLKQLALTTGDYTDFSDTDEKSVADWKSLLNTRVREIWEMFDWNELCDIYELPLEPEDGYRCFELPENMLFWAAWDKDPRKFDVSLDELTTRPYGKKRRVPSYVKDRVFARLQKAAPYFLDDEDLEIPNYIGDPALHLAFSDIQSQNGQDSKAASRRTMAYGMANTNMSYQTKGRRDRLRMN